MFPTYDIFHVSAVKLTDALTARHSGGVALLVRKEFSRYIEQFRTEYDNIVVLKLSKELFGTESDIVLLGTYVPPVNSVYYKDTDISSGLSIVEQCMMDVMESMGDPPFILFGDLNARTGKENAAFDDVFLEKSTNTEEFVFRFSKDTDLNEFGKQLLCLCEQFDLTIVNGTCGEESGNYTYVSSSGCSVIDYFVVSNRISLSSLSLKVAEKIESKHMPLELLIKVQNSDVGFQRNLPKTYKIAKYIWCTEKEQDFSSNLLSGEVKTCFSEAEELIDIDINLSLKKFNEGIQIAGQCMKKEIVIGKEKQNKWFDKECYESRQEVRKQLRKFHKSNAATDKDAYTARRNEYKELLRQKKTSHRQTILDSLHNSSNNPATFWKTIKSISAKKSISNKIEKEEWYQHFHKLFNDFPEDDTENYNSNESDTDSDFGENVDIDVLESDITECEVYAAIRSLGNRKAAGPDGMIGEFFKNSAASVVPFLVKYFNKLFTSGSYPEDWSEAIIHPLHKKGDVDSPDNYRGISLLCICSKLYSYILNKRLTDWIEDNKLIHESQAGFRKKYSTIDHLFTLVAMIQRQLLYHRKLYVAFIDFKKAFDSVVRSKLWGILRRNGVKGRMYKAITSMYNAVKAKVRAGGELSDSFMCPRGLKQGEITSPILFSIFINELANEIILHGKHGIQLMPDLIEIFILLFADDVILVSDTVSGLQNQLNVLWDTANKLDLLVNLDKSNIIVFRNGGHIASNEKWIYGNTPVEIVNVYKYLGIYLSTRLSFSHALNSISERAKKGVIAIFKILWSLGERSPAIFFKLFDTQIQPMLNYGAEVWGLDADLAPVEKVHLFALKRFLNTSTRTPNLMVYGETGRRPLFVNIFVKCIKFWLRIIAMPHDRLPYKAYKMLLHIHEQNKRTWATSVCYVLYKYGFDDVWVNQGAGNEGLFLKEFKSRLISSYEQDWMDGLNNKERYSFYSTFKSSLSLSPYLSDLKHVKARNFLIRLRLGVSPLKIHKFRYSRNRTDVDYSCPFCPYVTETEVHFVLACPKYTEIREMYIPRKYYRCPSSFKLALLLAVTNKSVLLRLATYAMKAFQLRAALSSNAAR